MNISPNMLFGGKLFMDGKPFDHLEGLTLVYNPKYDIFGVITLGNGQTWTGVMRRGRDQRMNASIIFEVKITAGSLNMLHFELSSTHKGFPDKRFLNWNEDVERFDILGILLDDQTGFYLYEQDDPQKQETLILESNAFFGLVQVFGKVPFKSPFQRGAGTSEARWEGKYDTHQGGIRFKQDNTWCYLNLDEAASMHSQFIVRVLPVRITSDIVVDLYYHRAAVSV